MARRKKINPRRRRPFIRKRAISSGLNAISKLLPFIIAAVVIALSLKAAVSLLLESDYFKVKTIKITGEPPDRKLGGARIDLNSKKGVNIFKIDLKRCESGIRSSHPELKDVKVRRILPDLLEVSYQVRRPFCQVYSGYFYLVSDDAVVFPNRLIAAAPALPIITGIDISERHLTRQRRIRSGRLQKAISLLKEIEESNFSKFHKVVKIDIYDPRNPVLYIEDATRIEIGEYSFKEREAVLQKVLDDLESKDRKAKIIDLRFEDVVVVPR